MWRSIFFCVVLRLSAARFLAWLITFSTIASIPKAALERRRL
ncbi:hypothetical protein [Nostoc commune]|nr:hypothetical protein [Nostoc commune]